ncbi:MAG: septum formation initiator family protein [Lachnospiraceae bacterium]|nr:septum formation initiator family protein [Lachnospiraceae bacterium]
MAEYRTQRRYLVNGSSAVREQEERQVERKPVKKRQRRVLPRTAVDIIPIAYVFMVAVSCICILAFSVMYIHARTEVTALSKQVSTLQATLEDIKQDNQDLQNEITTCTSIDTIRKKATQKLGMVPADETQIVYYDSSDSEYVRQKEDIPNE